MWAFAAAALILIIIPGPDQALITRNALAAGRAAGMMTMIGGALGLTIHASAAALGVSALLLASATAFTVLKIVGAAGTALRYVRHGFLSNSLNPKVALFFVTFLPQFISAESNAFGRALLLSFVFAMLYIAWFCSYVLTVDLVGAVLRRRRVRAAIERVTGLLLIGFGVRLAMEAS